MRITVLAYLEREEDTKGDVVVGQVAKALRANGHEVSKLLVHGKVGRLIGGLRRRKPELVFNLMEMFADNWFGDVPVVGMLDLLGLKYTGGGPGEFYLGQDKGLAKKILGYEGIPSPKYAIFTRDADPEITQQMRFPLFVKPLRGDASLGIDRRGLVHDVKSLMARVVKIQDQHDDAALVEEYIDGREFFVGILGNADPRPLPPVEVDFSGLPPGAPRILTNKAKFDTQSAEYRGTKSVIAEIDDELRQRLWDVSVEAYKALRVRDYGRIDLRLTDSGEIYVLEVNPSCYLEKDSEFAMAAAAAGIPYNELVQKIVEAAVDRYTKTGKIAPRRRRYCITPTSILHLIDGALPVPGANDTVPGTIEAPPAAPVGAKAD